MKKKILVCVTIVVMVVGCVVQEPASPEIVWLQQNAIPFDTAEPGGDYSDLMPLKDIIGDARIVALGEATHGTSEFFRMKHRILEFLVKEMGFDTFAIEATFPESLLINDYVHSGKGDPAQLLGGLKFWTWNTQEVLDMITWMREYNKNPCRAPEVSFYGFDMQFPGMAMDNVIEYVQQVDPEAVEYLESLYADFRFHTSGHYAQQEHVNASESAKDQCKKNVQEVYDFLKDHQVTYEAASTSEEFALALQNARICIQAERMYAGTGFRDQYMAENAAWLLDQAGPDSKIVLWAHNGHVGTDTDSPSFKPMGSYLREKYGDDMVVFGFAFYQGTFNAIYMPEPGVFGTMQIHSVESSPEESYEYYFHSTGMPRFFLDLRRIQPGSPATDWFLEPHSFHSIGSVYNEENPSDYLQKSVLTHVFDVIIYFEDTSPSQLLTFSTDEEESAVPEPADLARLTNAGFENGTSDWLLTGSNPEDYKIDTDETVVYSGEASGCIMSIGDGAQGFGTLMQTFRADEYRGHQVRMSAYVKTERVTGWAGLWMRVDGPKGVLSFDNMGDRPIRGDTEWTLYEVVLDVPEESINISFGVLMEGPGQVWVDDFQFEIADQNSSVTRLTIPELYETPYYLNLSIVSINPILCLFLLLI
ncbi:MAG: erythromycin esterase family protein [Theionarchaea archaeon]|nr:erythromycin esterase family protein [Theionarchaea archaeon]